jgi:2-methylcitrate dehydratase PrpD
VAALGIAGSASGGLLEFLNTGSATKQLHPGTASLNGILAARLAAAGASGPATVLEGEHGLWAALSDRAADPAVVTDGLGSRWEVERITIKPYPACQLMHVTLDAVATAVDGQAVAASDVVSVTADVHPDSAAIVCEPAADKVTPRSVYDAKFSLPWSVAALLMDGAIGVDTYSTTSIARPQVADLAGRVRTVLTAGDGVAADAAGRVRVALADGRTLTGEVPRSAGGPDAPLSDAALAEKFDGNVGGGSTAVALRDAVRGLRGAANLTALITAAAAAGVGGEAA